jgi:hypothetical protein
MTRKTNFSMTISSEFTSLNVGPAAASADRKNKRKRPLKEIRGDDGTVTIDLLDDEDEDEIGFISEERSKRLKGVIIPTRVKT